VAYACYPTYSGGRDKRIVVQSQPGQIVLKTLSQEYPSQKGLVEWLKVKALSSSPSAAKNKRKEGREEGRKEGKKER
jgi:hypothetical protein